MFFALPYRVRGAFPSDAIPLANALIVVLNVLAFSLGFSGGWYVGPGTGTLSVVTYAFAHASPWHLAGNMWILLVFGNPVNRRLGNIFYTLVYLATVLALGIFARLLCGGYLMGSSGAIFAIVAVFLFLMPASWIDVGYLAIFPFSLPFGVISCPGALGLLVHSLGSHQCSRRVGDCTGADVGILGAVLVGVELDELGAPAGPDVWHSGRAAAAGRNHHEKAPRRVALTQNRPELTPNRGNRVTERPGRGRASPGPSAVAKHRPRVVR